jgi:hypothetical protein
MGFSGISSLVLLGLFSAGMSLSSGDARFMLGGFSLRSLTTLR